MTESAKLYYELVEKRATCRNFKPDPIPGEVLNRILDAGCKAPSGGGFQSWSIVKVTSPETRGELVKCSRGQKFIATAPVSLVFCVDFHRMKQVMEIEPAPMREDRELHNFWMSLIDVAICAQTVTLAAEAEGLKSCYNGNIINMAQRVSELLGLPEHVFPALMLTLGYPKLDRRQPPKYPRSLLVHDEQYRETRGEDIYRAYRKQNNYQKIPPRPEQVEAVCQAAQTLHGAEYAARVREDISQKGYIGPYQYWFGCYYLDEEGFMTREDYLRFFREKGFSWF